MNNTIYRALVGVFLLVFVGCQGPVFYRTRIYEMPADAPIWGEFSPGKLVRLKHDVLVSSDLKYGSNLEPQGSIQIAAGVSERLSIEAYRANPKQWSQYTLIEQGTILRCVKLTIHDTPVAVYSGILTEIHSGEHKAKTVNIGLLLHSRANSEGLASLHPNPRFLEIIE